MNGDGASWIKEGLFYLPYGIYQLDRFHLNMALLRVYGNKKGAIGRIKEYIEKDDYESMYKYIHNMYNEESDENKKEKIAKLKVYLKNNKLELKDYRKRGIDFGDIELRGMGTSEANIDKILANRIKKKGMSWSIKGLNSICKILAMQANGELGAYCRRDFEGGATRAKVTINKTLVNKAKKLIKTKKADKYDRNVHMNIFDAPREEWMNTLKSLISNRNILKTS